MDMPILAARRHERETALAILCDPAANQAKRVRRRAPLRTLVVLASVMIALVVTLLITHEARADPKPAKMADTFVNSMGVQLHTPFKGTPYHTDFENIKASMAELGIKHVRDTAHLHDPARELTRCQSLLPIP
jgi:hypothetical protein